MKSIHNFALEKIESIHEEYNISNFKIFKTQPKYFLIIYTCNIL